jgi:glycosyltransferase involved in cell wall biosynthesis
VPVLSLCMIVKNEEKFLRECLESVKSVADEIVIVDTGSTDRTIEIAKEYNANVFPFEWSNSFSAARNFALSNCTGNWILYLDADERLSEKSIEELKKNIIRPEKFGIKCTVRNIESESGRDNTMKYTRLFRNISGIEFSGRIHEQIDPALAKLNFRILNSNIEIIHLGYNISDEGKREKARRNLDLLLRDFEESGSNYIAYQLAQSYNILEDMENSEKYALIAVNGKSLNQQQRAISYGLLANNFLKKHDVNSALYYINEALKWDASQPYLNLLTSKIYLRMQDYSNAEEYCRRALDTNTKLLTGNNSSSLDIILNEEEILYYGICLTKISKNQRYYNLYMNSLKKFFEKKGISNSETKINILRKIWADENLINGDSLEVVEIITRFNIEFIIELIKSYKISESKLNILNKIANDYLSNTSFATIYGVTLAENNLINEAIKILETVIQSRLSDPSTVFYLISLYVKVNQLNKIIPCIKLLETDFGFIPEVKARLPLLKQKLSHLG